MGGRPTDAEVLAKLDVADNPVTRSSLKDVCVSRLRDAVKKEIALQEEIELLKNDVDRHMDIANRAEAHNERLLCLVNDLASVANSVSMAEDRKVQFDSMDEPGYWQLGEWCEWVSGMQDVAREAIANCEQDMGDAAD